MLDDLSSEEVINILDGMDRIVPELDIQDWVEIGLWYQNRWAVHFGDVKRVDHRAPRR